MKADQENVKGLLRDAIIALCRDALSCKEDIVVEGLLGITVDKKDVFLVGINESFTGPNREVVPSRKYVERDAVSLLSGKQSISKFPKVKHEQKGSEAFSATGEQFTLGDSLSLEGAESFNLTVANVQGNANYYYNQSNSSGGQVVLQEASGAGQGSEGRWSTSEEPQFKKRRKDQPTGTGKPSTVRLVLAGNSSSVQGQGNPGVAGLPTMRLVLANGNNEKDGVKIAVVDQATKPQTVNIMGQMVQIKQEQVESDVEEDVELYSNLYQASHWELTPDHLYNKERPLYSPIQGRRGAQIMMHEFCDECGDHRPQMIPPTPRRSHPQKRCRVCYKKGTRKESRYCCPLCPGFPGLCVVPCFDLYHADNQFHSQNSEIEIITETDTPERLMDGSLTIKKEIIRRRCKPGIPILTEAESYLDNFSDEQNIPRLAIQEIPDAEDNRFPGRASEVEIITETDTPERLMDGSLIMKKQIVRKSMIPGIPILSNSDGYLDSLSGITGISTMAAENSPEAEDNSDVQYGSMTMDIDTAASINSDTAASINNDTAASINDDTAASINDDTAASVNDDTAASISNDVSPVDSPNQSESDSNSESSPRARFLRMHSPRTYSRRKKKVTQVLYTNAEEKGQDFNSSSVDAPDGSEAAKTGIKPGSSLLLKVIRDLPTSNTQTLNDA